MLSISLCILVTLSLIGCNLFGGSKDTTTTQKNSVDTTQKSTVDKDSTSQGEEKQSKTTNSQTKDSSDDNIIKIRVYEVVSDKR